MHLSAGAAVNLAFESRPRHGAGVNQTRSRGLLLSSLFIPPHAQRQRPSARRHAARLHSRPAWLNIPPLLCPLPAPAACCPSPPHVPAAPSHKGAPAPRQRAVDHLDAAPVLSPPAASPSPSPARNHPPPTRRPATCPGPPHPSPRHPADVGLGVKGTAADQISAPGAEPAPVPPRIVVSHRAVPPQALFQKSSVHRASRLVKLDLKHQPQLTRRYRRLSQQLQ
jgi:hypothetical protein